VLATPPPAPSASRGVGCSLPHTATSLPVGRAPSCGTGPARRTTPRILPEPAVANPQAALAAGAAARTAPTIRISSPRRRIPLPRLTSQARRRRRPGGRYRLGHRVLDCRDRLQVGEDRLRSSSVAWAYICHGIGGSRSRPSPWCLPRRIVLTNMSSVQLPRPVAWSGVRLRVNEMPHGPTHAVSSALDIDTQPDGDSTPAAGAGGAGSSARCPESRRVSSSAGPLSVITFGVWQSWQAPSVTR
jgi:hypothetical protein